MLISSRLAILVLLNASVALTSTAEEKPTAPRKNVLMICIDDLNDWTGFLGGHPDVITPHMDKLAASGRNFTNAHCVVPVCSPSRICIMSGLHATTHGSYDLGPAYETIERLKIDSEPTKYD